MTNVSRSLRAILPAPVRRVARAARHALRTVSRGATMPAYVARSSGDSSGAQKPIRVAFVVCRTGPEAATVRYRAHTVIEAVRVAGHVADDFDAGRIGNWLGTALGYDLIVLVRRPHSADVDALIDAANRAGVPVVADMDDVLFDADAIPHIAAFQTTPAEFGRGVIDSYRKVILRADYFTGATPFLAERAALAGRPGFAIRNGHNAAQRAISDRVWETAPRPADGRVRLGYFSGTRTHQADFGLIAPTLAALMAEFLDVRLVVVGDLDVDEFPDLARYRSRVECRPLVAWPDLPAEIARVDVNLAPLELNTFTHGKSNLKYYEAALVRVPTVASPTRAYAAGITSGENGYLAASPAEWAAALRTLITSPVARAWTGERAYRRAVVEYGPGAVADEALAAYRAILSHHARR